MSATSGDVDAIWLAVGLVFGLVLGLYIRRREQVEIPAPMAADGGAPEPPDEGYDPNDPENWIGLDFAYESIMAQLDRQEKRWEEVDGRLRLVLGVIGIVFAVAAGFVRSSQPAGSDPLAGLLRFWNGGMVIAAVTLHLLAGGIAFLA